MIGLGCRWEGKLPEAAGPIQNSIMEVWHLYLPEQQKPHAGGRILRRPGHHPYPPSGVPDG